MRRILVTNDDGIHAPGIAALAACAAQFGEVTVIAPKTECSAMSQKITLGNEMTLAEEDIGVPGVRALSLTGTPTDCVRLGVTSPAGRFDLVLSGINAGANSGFDIQYSATVSAAMEALSFGVPAMCFSQMRGGSEEVRESKLTEILESLLSREIAPGEAWNVNFPSCPLSEFQGIREDCVPARMGMFQDWYVLCGAPGGPYTVSMQARRHTAEEAEEGSDIRAILDGCIAIGKVRNRVMCP